jgi:hypothetical protein
MSRAGLLGIVIVAVALAAVTLLPAAAWAQGNPVGPEFRVNTYTTGNQGASSAIALDAAGNFVVVWDSIQTAPFGGVVFGQRFAASGAPLGPEFLVGASTTGFFGLVSVASDPAGNFLVVWMSDTGGGAADSTEDVFGQRYAASGIPLGPTFRVNTYTTWYQNQPEVASDPSGGFVVVWNSTPQGIVGQRFASSGAPVGPEFIVNTHPPGYQLSPDVASDANGGFVVAWQSGQEGPGAPAYTGIYARRYGSGGIPLGPEFHVNTSTPYLQTGASVASAANGAFVVVWQSYVNVGPDLGIYGQRYASSGTPVGPEFRVDTTPANMWIQPSVASDSSGNFVVTWTSDTTNSDVFGQRFASSGSPLGPQFRVNTYTPGSQQQSAVAPGPLGDFVVVWKSAGQDGSLYGVFGQRFGPIVPVELMDVRVE